MKEINREPIIVPEKYLTVKMIFWSIIFFILMTTFLSCEAVVNAPTI